MTKLETHYYIDSVLNSISDSIQNCPTSLAYSDACTWMSTCRGHVVVTGVGKAGLVGKTISATLASTGTKSFFLNPLDALHGDLGMVGEDDLVLILSNSGSTAELSRLVPHLKKIGCVVILMTGDKSTDLAKMCDVIVCYGKIEEAGPFGLAPTTSAVLMLAIGDALAMAVMKMREFSAEDYARYHPGGALGGKALTVDQVCRPRSSCALASINDSPEFIEREIIHNHTGICCILLSEKLIGVCSLADVARNRESLQRLVTESPITVLSGSSVGEAMAVMRKNKINQLPVVDEGMSLIGVVDIQELVGLRLDI